jgi:hypothetical protein
MSGARTQGAGWQVVCERSPLTLGWVDVGCHPTHTGITRGIPSALGVSYENCDLASRFSL